MSSRNSYLNAEDRQAALTLHRSLQQARELAESGETDAHRMLEEMLRAFAAGPRASVDYVAVVDPVTFRPVKRVRPGCVALVAARAGGVRLIDNMIFGPPMTSEEERLELALGLDCSAADRSDVLD
jgi:pantoate--beta-alanine ligase